jgi:hypothetical protein
MIELLEIIVKNCIEHGVRIESELSEDGRRVYFVYGYSKNVYATLRVDGYRILCETQDGVIRDVLTVRDLAYTLIDYYKSINSTQEATYGWENIFEKFYIYSSELRLWSPKSSPSNDIWSGFDF